MDGYKHYIKVDGEGIVIHGFSEVFAQPQTGDIQLTGEFGRLFQIPLLIDVSPGRTQYKYKIVGGAMVERTQVELDAEWDARPAPPKTDDQKETIQLKAQIAQQSAANTEFMEFVLSTLGV